jgi:NAD(P)-dependent dehydrogenase (short-subunit alcohol dehydrogenase family)
METDIKKVDRNDHMTSMQLKNQVVILTGASEGIGRVIAQALAEEGACLVLAARTPEKLAAVAAEIRAMGNQVLDVPTDVTRPREVEALVQKTIDAFGRVDLLINNVGRGLRKPFTQTTDEDWSNLIATNLSSVLYGCRAVLPQMERQGSGLIINIISRSGRVGEANLAAYCAVKHGVAGLTKALAEEEGPKGIHVNAVCPGAVRTERMERMLPQVDKSNWLAPEQVAKTVLFVATTAGRTMQGQMIDLF